jgi:crotonobetainyl-CoA:carnitine CoA-transferase CaiB-like acyl-CoA transferase
MLANVGRRTRAARARRRGYTMQHAVQVAIARFPDRGHAIAELARTDEGFQSLCEDFAAAQAALVHWERSSSPVREARCAEYRELVRDLAVEIQAELDRHSQE